MDVLRLGTAGNLSVSDLVAQLSEAYDLNHGKVEVLVLEAIRWLTNERMIQLSESPLPSRKLHEGPSGVVGRALISLTYRCNFRCIHCLQGSKDFVPPPELGTNDWYRILKEMSEYGISFLFVTGGEPLLRRDTIDVLNEAAEYAFPTRLYTNASLVNPDLADRLAVIDNLWVQISLHGIDSSSCDPFLGVNGAFKKIIEGIRLLSERGIKVSVATAFRDELIQRMNEFPQLLTELGVREWVPTLIMPMGCAFENWRGLRASDETLRTFMEDILRIASIYKDTDFNVYTPFSIRLLQSGESAWEQSPALSFSCNLYGQYINVDPEGNVHPCDRLTGNVLGNLRQESLTEILSKKAEITRQKIEHFQRMKQLGIWDKCSNCIYRNLCGMGCPAILYQGKSLNEPEFDPIVCRIFQKCFDILAKYSTTPAAHALQRAIEEPIDAGKSN